MAWVFNYDGDDLQGWFINKVTGVGALSSLGMSQTWVAQAGGMSMSVWSCYLWLWNFQHGWLIKKLNVEHCFEVKPWDVAWNPWMQHPVGRFQ